MLKACEHFDPNQENIGSFLEKARACTLIKNSHSEDMMSCCAQFDLVVMGLRDAMIEVE